MPRPDPISLAKRIEMLSPAEKLRLAADLLEKQRADLAHSIASGVVTELGAALCLQKVRKG